MDPSLITSNNMIFKEIRVKVVLRMFSRAALFRFRMCSPFNTLGIHLEHYKVSPNTTFIILNTVYKVNLDFATISRMVKLLCCSRIDLILVVFLLISTVIGLPGDCLEDLSPHPHFQTFLPSYKLFEV
jgi:hypothetical protein